jgi:transposase
VHAEEVEILHLCTASMNPATAIDYQLLYEEMSVRYEALKHELEQLKKLIYGSRHERFVSVTSSPSQLALDIQADVTPPTSAPVQTLEYTRSKVPHNPATKVATGRMKLPESLPRERVVIEPAEDVSGLKKIGEEITEELELIEAELYVKQYVRPKYAKQSGEGILIAELPARPIGKGIAGPGLLAQVVIDKYMDHLPLYRQMERFKRAGITLPDSTLGGWVRGVCNLLTPLYETLKTTVLQTHYLHVDETPIKVLDKDKKGSTHRGYYWVYHNSHEKLVLFDYQMSRGREGPEGTLKDFQGYLQSDGYGVYEGFASREGITLLHCMAHARRMFVDAVGNDGPRAEYALEKMQLLYALEQNGKEKELSFEQLALLRHQQAAPILKHLGEWMQQQYAQVLPKSPIGKALAYSIERWEKLCLYTTHGMLCIDNNPVENSIRPVAVGRKNYLFAGSHEAAQRSAMLYSLLGTCKLHGINPFQWLKAVLEKLPAHPINRIHELLPQNGKP